MEDFQASHQASIKEHLEALTPFYNKSLLSLQESNAFGIGFLHTLMKFIVNIVKQNLETVSPFMLKPVYQED